MLTNRVEKCSSVLCELVLGFLEVLEHLRRDLRKVAPRNDVVRLQEDLPQPRLAAGVVLQVEAVEAVERPRVRVHVQRVNGQVVPVHTHTHAYHTHTLWVRTVATQPQQRAALVRGDGKALEHLRKREELAVAEDHQLVGVVAQLALCEDTAVATAARQT